MKRTFPFFLVLLLCGCGSLFAGGPSAKRVSVFSLVLNYKMPTSPIACTDNPDAAIDATVKKLFGTAIARGFMVDGSHANEGVLIFSRAGRAKPMMVVVEVFQEEKTGTLAMQKSRWSDGADMKACLAFHEEVVRLLKQK